MGRHCRSPRSILALVRCLVAIATLPSAVIAGERATVPQDAVVFVRVSGTLTTDYTLGWRRSDQREGVELGTGSGFSITTRGHVLTNLHVVGDQRFEFEQAGTRYSVVLESRNIQVAMPRGEEREARTHAARVVATDATLDLALLEVDGPPIPYLPLGDSEANAAGVAVRALGFPFGEQVAVGRALAPDIVPQHSVTAGSLVARRPDDENRTRYLQTDAVVNPGSSGGPLVDPAGRAIGVVRMRLADTSAAFAVPIELGKDFLDRAGYAQFLPAQRLALGSRDELPHKAISMRLPTGASDRSESRQRVEADASLSSVQLQAERLATTWSAARLRDHLEKDAATDGSSAWHVVEAADEALIARYVGEPDELAFNASVIAASLESVRIAPLADSPVTGPVAITTFDRRRIGSDSPDVLLPSGWFVAEPAAAAKSCAPTAADSVEASPQGDFTVSFRAYWHPGGGASPEVAARRCSRRSSGLGSESYVRSQERFGSRSSAEGLFLEVMGGLLQLEVSAPDEKLGFLTAIAGAWVRGHLDLYPQTGASGTAGGTIER